MYLVTSCKLFKLFFYIFTIGFLFNIFTACVTQQDHCGQYNLYQKGFSDALDGYPLQEGIQLVYPIEQNCYRKYNIKFNYKEYKRGYTRGLEKLCCFDGGYSFGVSNRIYKKTCSGNRATEFLKGFSKGLLEYDRINKRDRRRKYHFKDPDVPHSIRRYESPRGYEPPRRRESPRGYEPPRRRESPRGYEPPRRRESPIYKAPRYEPPKRYESPKKKYESPVYKAPRYEPPKKKFESPIYKAPRYEPPGRYEPPKKKFESPIYKAPRYEPPGRYEPPKKKYESPIYKAPRYEPPGRYEPPKKKFESPIYKAPRYEPPKRFDSPKSFNKPSFSKPAFNKPSFEKPSKFKK